MGWLDQVVYWHWWMLAGILLVLELIRPVYYLLWLGIAAATVGFLLLSFGGLDIEVQLLAFGVLALIAVVVLRRYREFQPVESLQADINSRAEQLVNREFTLEHPIFNGVGEIEVDDSTWRVNGPDLPAGARVRVTRVDGAMLLVEPSDGA